MSKPTISISLTPVVIVLAILKLMGKIAISWLWVFSPIWLPIVIVLSIATLFAILALVFGITVKKVK